MARQVYAGMRRDGGPIGFWVYIMANKRNGTTYVGSPDDLAKRVHEHRHGFGARYTRRYGCGILVWAELHETREGAFIREQRIKDWKRPWKLRLIEELNPTWSDRLDYYLS